MCSVLCCDAFTQIPAVHCVCACVCLRREHRWKTHIRLISFQFCWFSDVVRSFRRCSLRTQHIASTHRGQTGGLHSPIPNGYACKREMRWRKTNGIDYCVPSAEHRASSGINRCTFRLRVVFLFISGFVGFRMRWKNLFLLSSTFLASSLVPSLVLIRKSLPTKNHWAYTVFLHPLVAEFVVVLLPSVSPFNGITTFPAIEIVSSLFLVFCFFG